MSNLIQIGESIHASIPKSGGIMKELLSAGAGSLEKPSDARDFIISLIESQVDHRADYIAINVDAFGEDDPQISVNLMREYVQLVRQYSRQVPVCIDSSDDDALEAGLDQWYKDSDEKVAPPLVNSVKTSTIERILSLRQKHPFKVVGMLVDENEAGGDNSYSAEKLYQMAREIFDAACGKYGFEAGDLFMDSTLFPLAIDVPMMPGVSGYTYRTFEAIRKIMNDPAMKGVHTSLGISNCAKDLPGRRVGVCRAYIALAQEYGLDAGIVNVMDDYGLKPVAPELTELVKAFALQDGTPEKSEKAMELMGQFCRDNRKPPVKKS